MYLRARRRIAFLAALALVVSASSLLRAGAPQAVGTWRSIGAAPDTRVGAAAVALPDGRVLVTGGIAAGSETASVSVFNPADGSFTANGQLLLPRSAHTATLLKDGRVLVAGGMSQGARTSDLEIFDPATQVSTVPGSLIESRSGHAAALLPDGRVFITGGTGADGVLDTSDVFDPSDNSVAATGLHMLSPRTGASATTLIDGRVLIAGGNDGTKDLATAEIFDPYAMTFEATTTALSVARSGHTAVLLPGNNSVLVAGGSSNGVAQTATDLFVPTEFPDPYSWGMGTFALTSPLTGARAGAIGAPHIDGYSVVIGGGASDAEVYRFPTLKTDADDYPPGTPAIITGAGWQPDTDVMLVFQEDPAVHDDYVLTVHADAEGKIFWDQWAPEAHDLNVRFYLLGKQRLADGSERRAQITFTDGNANSVSGTVHNGSASGPVLSGVTITCTSGCNTTPNPSTTTAANGTYAFSGGNKLSFAGNGPATLQLTASKSGFTSQTISVLISANGATVTGADFVMAPSIASTALSVQAATGTYGGTADLSATLTSGGTGVQGKTVAFTLNGVSAGSAQTNAAGVASITGASLNSIAAGSYPSGVAASFIGDTAFSPASGTAALTVDQAVLTITPDGGKTKNYGQTFTAFTGTVSGLQNNDAGTATYASAGAPATANVGPYDITSSFVFTQGLASNYEIHANTATNGLTVGKATLTITPDGGKTKTYGETFTAFTGTKTGLVNGDDGTVTYASPGAPATANVGPYDITSSFVFTQGLASNYDVHANTATNGLTVGKATLTITPDGGKTKTYGETFTAFTGTKTGLVNGDDGTVTYASPGAPATANVGPYDITSSFVFTQGLASNYEIHANTATNGLTVGKATLTITPDGGKTKTYGQLFTAFTGTVMGLQNNDAGTPTYASTGAPAAAYAGSYDITSSFSFTTGLASNYDVHANTAVNGLTVNRAPLSITPDGGKTKLLGDTFTAFTGTVSGLVNGDQGTAIYASAGAPPAAGVGAYDITSSFVFTVGSASNYDVQTNTALKGLTVGYGVCVLYDQTKAVKQNATVPVKFYLCTAAGQDVSSAGIVVTATTLTPTAGSAAAQVEDSGNANPDNNFRFDASLGPSGGYIFNLSTKGVPAAMWKLTFTVSGGSFGTYNVGFGVK